MQKYNKPELKVSELCNKNVMCDSILPFGLFDSSSEEVQIGGDNSGTNWD